MLSFTYDSLGRLLSETFPESGTSSFTYDDNGNVLSKQDARGVVVRSAYDALNRRTGTTFSDGTPSAAYVYDETSNDLIGLITSNKGRNPVRHSFNFYGVINSASSLSARSVS